MKYRVDRADSNVVPCGMNSIRYFGESYKEALKVYNELEPGFDAWNRPNASYGVILSQYKPPFGEDKLLLSKGLEED